MESEIDMGEQTFILINGPLIFLNLAANIFYACCLIFPPRNAPRLKQPLKRLLGCLFWSSTGYCVSLVLLYCVIKEKKHLIMSILSWVTVLFFLHNSMSCSVWLNFYYYIQIVPAQRALMVWVKRNIKSVMNMALLFDGTLCLFSDAIYSASQILTFSYINGTETGHQIDGLYFTKEVFIYINNVHIFLNLCIMTVSSFSTARYLHRHMKSVAQGFSTPRIQSQMRVTITGISQGVFYFLYGTFYIYNSFTHTLPSSHVLGTWISFTAISLYISGTTVNLGIGQAVCRQTAADGWKALKALCGAGMVTHDMKIHSSHHTSELESLTGFIRKLTTREEDTRTETVSRLKMDYPVYVLINAPLVLLNIVANSFYMFCMVRPLHGERIKQPLKLLLGSLICCTITYLMATIVMFFFGSLPGKIAQIAHVVAICSMTTSMTSSVWLSFFYYTQIVPAQRALFIWIKKNIKSIIYCILLVDRLYSVLDFTVLFIANYPSDRFGSSTNFTTGPDLLRSEIGQILFIITVCMVRANSVFCLCVILMSSVSTVIYLSRHMRRMVANGQSLSGPRFSGQVRVTVIGILQGVLHMFCAVWDMYMIFSWDTLTYFSPYINFTIINLYMSGTTFNLGASQAVFRQRAAHIWLRAAQCCKAPQVQQSEPGG